MRVKVKRRPDLEHLGDTALVTVEQVLDARDEEARKRKREPLPRDERAREWARHYIERMAFHGDELLCLGDNDNDNNNGERERRRRAAAAAVAACEEW